ncbi:MAG: metallophosphoesterase [Kiritimatiellae bacterium]|nr:metallophosphoesterase [Kiritimatiellia bacterium]
MKRREFLMASMGATIASTIKLEGQTPPPAEKTDVVEVGEMLDPDHLICVKPHVQLISETEVGLVWMTSKEAEGWVEWSQDDGETWKRAWNERDGLLVDACDRIHKITVSGYSPAKPFRYRVRSRAFTSFGPYRVVRSAEEAVYEGEINAVVPADGTISFAMFNDVHNKLEIYPALCKRLEGALSFTVFNGDIMNHIDDEPGVCKCLMAPLAYVARQTRAPMWYLRGNHETRGKFARHLRDYVALQNGHYYGAVTLGNARFVFVDTGEDKADDHKEYSGLVDFEHYIAHQTQWLAEEVSSPAWKDAKFRVVFMHIPPDGVCGSGRIWSQRLPRVRKLHAVLENAGVTLLLGAHLHNWACDDARPERPYPMVIGGGNNLTTTRQWSLPTLTHCTIQGNTLTVKLLSPDGKVLAQKEVAGKS